jgi:hypothetical protein
LDFLCSLAGEKEKIFFVTGFGQRDRLFYNRCEKGVMRNDG